jgi:hypothetical protein
MSKYRHNTLVCPYDIATSSSNCYSINGESQTKDLLLVTQGNRYQPGEVFLVWGTDGRAMVSKETRLARMLAQDTFTNRGREIREVLP